MSRIFLSHSSTDNFAARALADWLAAEGWVDVFLDIDPERGIAAGQRWERSLHQAADRCEAVVFLVTRAWLSSGWCRKEYELARSLNKQLFAVIVERGLGVADLPPELKDTWQVTDLAAGADHRIFRATLPSSDEERHVSVSQGGLDRLRAGLKKAGLNPATFRWPSEGVRDPAPYVGLRALGADEAGLFFGRDADLVKALDRLRGLAEAASPRIAVILGASGAGKSSFLRAGLMPRMARDDARFLCLPAIRPQRDTIEGESGLIAALDAAVAGPHSRAEIRAAVANGAEGMGALIGPLVEAAMAKTLADRETARPPVVVIPIDQAEELFGADADGAKLLTLLADLAKVDAPAVMLLFAIRSDAYDALEQAKPLEGLAQLALPLLPMPRHAARAVIEGPAARYRESVGPLDLDPRLTQSLLDDLDKGGRDTLPLLAFTLEHLWREYAGTGALKLAHYEGFGVAGAIEAGVKRAYLRADQDPRIPRDQAARDGLLRRGLVPWLAGIDPDTKAPRRNVARAADIPEESRPLIDLLVEERLLSRSVDEAKVATIEPAHEALLRQWGKLRGWLDEDFALLAALEALQRASRDWDANTRSEAWLAHRGQRLTEAAALDARSDLAAKLGPQDREYLAACRAHEEAQRAEAEARRREREEMQARRLADAQVLALRTGIGLVVATILALAAGAFGLVALREWTIADQKTDEARAQTTKAQAATAEAEKNFQLTLNAARNNFKIVKAAYHSDLISAETAESILNIERDTFSQLSTERESGEVIASLLDLLTELSQTYYYVGDANSALEVARHANRIAATWTTASPSNVAAKEWLTLSFDRLGDALYASGDLAAASDAFRNENKLAQTLVSAAPDNDERQHRLWLSYESLGDMLKWRGQLVDALANFRQAEAIAARLVEQLHPDNDDWRRDLGTLEERIGDILLASGDIEGAGKQYQSVLEIYESLTKKKPKNPDWQWGLMVAHERFGDLQRHEKHLDEARAQYAIYGEIAAQLASQDKTNDTWRRHIALSEQRRGQISHLQGHDEEAFDLFSAAYDALSALAKKDATSWLYQSDAEVGCENLGDALLGLSRSAEALEKYRSCLDSAMALAPRDASNAVWRRSVAVAHQRVGVALLALDDRAEALMEFRACLEAHASDIVVDETNFDPPQVSGDCQARAVDAAAAAPSPHPAADSPR